MSCMHHLFQETSSCIQAFSARGKVDCDSSSMMQEEWCICEDWALNKWLSGGGRKPALGNIEDLLADEIFKIWILTNKVTKTFICDCARQWPKSMNDFDYNWKLLHWDDFDCNWIFAALWFSDAMDFATTNNTFNKIDEWATCSKSCRLYEISYRPGSGISITNEHYWWMKQQFILRMLDQRLWT